MIKAVLFDAGDTLTRPIDGEWFPGSAFHRAVEEWDLRPNLEWDRLADAHAEGMTHLVANHQLETIEEEYDQFHEYFRRLLIGMGLESPARDLVKRIAYETVYGVGIEPFDDVRPTLDDLTARGLRLGIVSNSWPSLERRYRALGLRDYFDVFVISALVGALKPDQHIYDVALAQLDLPAEEAMFVDDWAEYADAAQRLGMRGAAIVRDPLANRAGEGMIHLTSLTEIARYLPD